MKESKGKIDVTMAEQFLADHVDTFEKKNQANDRASMRTCRCLSAWDQGVGMGSV